MKWTVPLFVLGFVLAVSATAAETQPGELSVGRASVRFAAAADADTCVIRGSFARPESLPYYDHERDAVQLTVGDATYEVPPLDPGIVVRVVGLSKGQRMLYRRPRGEHAGLRSLRVDLRRGRFVARVGPDDLGGVQDAGSWGVPVVLRVGACSFGATIDFTSRARGSAELWSHRARRSASRPLALDGMGDGQLDVARNEIVRDAESWTAIWQELLGRGDEPPAVDFDTEMVVVVAVGTRQSGGYAVRVDGVREIGGETVVRYTETVPGPRCVVTLALTHPYSISKVARTGTPGRFVGRVRTNRCLHDG